MKQWKETTNHPGFNNGFLHTRFSCVFEKKGKEYVESGSGEADQMLASSDHRKDLSARRIDQSLDPPQCSSGAQKISGPTVKIWSRSLTFQCA